MMTPLTHWSLRDGRKFSQQSAGDRCVLIVAVNLGASYAAGPPLLLEMLRVDRIRWLSGLVGVNRIRRLSVWLRVDACVPFRSRDSWRGR